MSEDVSVGAWLAPLDITRIHDTRFDTEYMSRGCNNSFIITHKQTPESMRTIFKHFVKTGNICEREFVSRRTYEYNWNVPPIKCCVPK